MKIKCPLCGFENEEDSKFCKNCNEPLVKFKIPNAIENPYIKIEEEDQPFEPISDEEVKVKNKIEKEEKKSSLGTGCIVFLVIIVGIFLIYFLPAIKANKEFREKPIPYVSLEDTIERVVEGVAIEAFGKTVNWELENRPNTMKKIVMTKQVSGPDEGGYLVEVYYRADENLTVNLMRGGIFLEAIEFTEKLYRDPNCKEVKVYMLKPYLVLTDKYGKEKEEQVAKLVLRREIANKVNWENITNDMFERILREEGQLWLHPALGN